MKNNWTLFSLISFLLIASCNDSDHVELGKNTFETIGFDRTSEIIDHNEHELYFSWETSRHWGVTCYSEITGQDTIFYRIDSCNSGILQNDTTQGNWFYALVKNGKFYVKVFSNDSSVDREVIIGMSGSEAGGSISIFQTGKE